MPTLSIITRSYRRPDLLARCVQSVARQTWPDVEHLIRHDPAGQGCDGANAALREIVPSGEWVMVLDDDDYLIDDRLTERLRDVAADTDVLIVSMDFLDRVLPDRWPPEETHIGGSCFIVRRAVWEHHRADWGRRYEGDFDFIRAVAACPLHRIERRDWIVSRIGQVGHGQPQ